MKQLATGTGPKLTPLWGARTIPAGSYYGDAKGEQFLNKLYKEEVPAEVLRNPKDLRQGFRRHQSRYGERIHIDLAVWAKQFSPIYVWGTEVFPGGEQL